MNKEDDWRLTGQENYLKGVTLVHRRYRLNNKNPEWDHDHCDFCWAKCSLYEDPEYLKEGYSTTDDYHWICPKCLEDFKDKFQWKIIEANSETQ